MTPTPPRTRLQCHGCGHTPPLDEPHPFRCPHADDDDDTDHVRGPIMDLSRHDEMADAFRSALADDDPNPFVRFRALSPVHEMALDRGLTDADFVTLVRDMDVAAADVDGSGFRTTPFATAPDLGHAIGMDTDRMWVKDETGNVSGSHKARHLMSIILWLEVLDRLEGTEQGEERDQRRGPALAIASCGNAALAAGVLASAARRPLRVFVPPDADPEVLGRLVALHADVATCPRTRSGVGDPCYERFRDAVAAGDLPFACQGNENGLNLDGGRTLAWEMIATLRATGIALEHLVVQVGGGALASACFQAFEEAHALGVIEHLPRLHAVQTERAHPLIRAHERVVDRLGGPHAVRDPRAIDQALRHAATHRASFMWPWETEPRSVARSILDDETYDWLAVVGGMLRSGGSPVAVSEELLTEAHELARTHTPSPVDPSGTAGLAGLLALRRSGVIDSGQSVGVLFTGRERGSVTGSDARDTGSGSGPETR